MLKAILIILAILFVAVAAVVAYAATKPDDFRIQRTASIKAPPDKIFPLIDDLRGFATWSPYENKDPNMKRTISDPSAGKGASYAWEGDKNVGAGRMEIVDTSPPNKVVIKLDMLKPFEAHNMVEFTLQPAGDTTNVTWAMNGQTPFLAKIVHVFINVDRMVGQDFEAGLAKLKTLTEK